MHIMLLILPIMLCSDSWPRALLCPKILPIMPHYALKISFHIASRKFFQGEISLWFSIIIFIYGKNLLVYSLVPSILNHKIKSSWVKHL